MKKLKLFLTALVLSLGAVLGVITPQIAHAVVNNCTWTGASNNNFNTAGNWSSCNSTVPQTGDNLIFDATSLGAAATLNNDIVGLSVGTITFQGTNGSAYIFTVGGNAITVASAINVTSQTYPTITANVTLGGNTALAVSNANGVLTINGNIGGSGNVTTTGTVILGGTNNFSGTVTASSGSLSSATASGLGSSSNVVTVSNGANLTLGDCSGSGFTVPNDITLTGASSNTSVFGKLDIGGSCSGGGGGTDETYAQVGTSNQAFTLSGHITLGSDVTFGGIAKQTTITGALSGNFKFTLPNTFGGQLIVNSSANTSGIANGTYNPDPITATLSDDQSAHTVTIGNNATVTIDGARGDTSVQSGGTLKGTGTVGALFVSKDGTVAPGHSPGCISSGNLTLTGNYQAEIGGTTPCTGYDQLKVTGTVDVTNGTLQVSLYNGFKPAKGQQYTIISNDGADAVTGTFSSMAEGSTFTVSGYVFKITYKGGDGNDVVLTVQTVPASPNTGFTLLKNNPLISMAIIFAAAGGIALLARRGKLLGHRR